MGFFPAISQENLSAVVLNPADSSEYGVYSTDGEQAFTITDKKTKKERVRLTAAILCITLGPFGVHRLYLGTKTTVPVFYTLTLGGGLGILPVADLFLIVFSKDLERYKDNPNVFMWTEK